MLIDDCRASIVCCTLLCYFANIDRWLSEPCPSLHFSYENIILTVISTILLNFVLFHWVFLENLWMDPPKSITLPPLQVCFDSQGAINQCIHEWIQIRHAHSTLTLKKDPILMFDLSVIWLMQVFLYMIDASVHLYKTVYSGIHTHNLRHNLTTVKICFVHETSICILMKSINGCPHNTGAICCEKYIFKHMVLVFTA